MQLSFSIFRFWILPFLLFFSLNPNIARSNEEATSLGIKNNVSKKIIFHFEGDDTDNISVKVERCKNDLICFYVHIFEKKTSFILKNDAGGSIDFNRITANFYQLDNELLKVKYYVKIFAPISSVYYPCAQDFSGEHKYTFTILDNQTGSSFYSGYAIDGASNMFESFRQRHDVLSKMGPVPCDPISKEDVVEFVYH